jgi:hypothetical protein
MIYDVRITAAERSEGAFSAAYARHFALYCEISQQVKQTGFDKAVPLEILTIMLSYLRLQGHRAPAAIGISLPGTIRSISILAPRSWKWFGQNASTTLPCW